MFTIGRFNRLAQWMVKGGLLAFALPSFAQTEPAAPQSPASAPMAPSAAASEPAVAQPAAPAASAPATELAPARKEQSTSLQTVTVTATRRSERLQDVPLAVSAVSGAQLESAGVKSLTDIARAVSGVTYGTSPQDDGFRVRGVGTLGGFSSSSEQPVGVVVDNVVMGLGSLVQSLNDVERIEVLKGPQGTQFGKNASSGVVSITTRRPSFVRLGGEVSASYGSLNEHDVNAQLNIPLASTVAAGISVFDKRYDGFVDNVTRKETVGGLHEYGGRAKLFIKASNDLDFSFSVDATKSELDGQYQLWTVRALPPVPPTLPGEFAAAGIVPGADNTKTSEGARGFRNQDASGASAEVNYRIGDYTLTSITAHRARGDQQRFGLDTREAVIMEGGSDNQYRQDSQELRVTSPKGELEYVAGIYWSQLKATQDTSAWLQPAALGAPAPPAGVFISLTNGINHVFTKSQSTALFADGKLRLSDELRLLAGVRVTQDKVHADNTVDTSAVGEQVDQPPGFLAPSAGRAPQAGDVSESKPSGRLGLEWKPAKDMLVYATAARGYLGPTVTYSNLTGTKTEVKSQTVEDFTVGTKTQFFDRKLTVNASIFQDTYKNLQVGRFVPADNEFVTENAGGMRSRGFELDVATVLTTGLLGRASVTYADAKFTDYVTACPTTGDRSRCNGAFFQGAGEDVPGAPKVTATLGLDYAYFFESGYQLDTSANYAWRSKTSYGTGETLYAQEGYGILSVAMKLSPESDKWHVGLWARNLLDEHYQAAVIGLPFAAPGGVVNWNARDARRTVGVTAGIRF